MNRSLQTAVGLMCDYQGWSEHSDEWEGAFRAHADHLHNVALGVKAKDSLEDLEMVYREYLESGIGLPADERIGVYNPAQMEGALRAIRLLDVMGVR